MGRHAATIHAGGVAADRGMADARDVAVFASHSAAVAGGCIPADNTVENQCEAAILATDASAPDRSRGISADLAMTDRCEAVFGARYPGAWEIVQ